ncbi:MAG TPA: choice-of-anchor Q domain-containing protein [Verrucomicrobiae bacterium]|nr:choice-of-anchor Q domain-containing protein [Verrucomicrobiae bacterium]
MHDFWSGTRKLAALSIGISWIWLNVGAGDVGAVERFVNLNSVTPISPYLTWASAARTIQEAVDVADDGDEIVVTNGVYQTGGRLIAEVKTTNRLAVVKPITVRSVNGPAVTVIKGYQVPGSTNGADAMRCVYLTDGARLVGFTLTGGATTLTNAIDDHRHQSGGGVWCASASVVVSNCVIVGNAAHGNGGGAYAGTLQACRVSGNSAYLGGGVFAGTLDNCTLDHNAASGGGGAASAILTGSVIAMNVAYTGGGTYLAIVHNCTLSSNSASLGGAAYDGVLGSCAIDSNSAGYGGGAYSGTLNNCTLVGNTASWFGGGYYDGLGVGTVNNCIVYHNVTLIGSPNYLGGIFNYSCTTPLPPTGMGNITEEPQLASISHLSAASPCVRAGSYAYVNGVDLDGEAWANPPSIGCDELHPATNAVPLTVAIAASFTNVATRFEVTFSALIYGPTSGSWWDFGDGTVVSNQPYAAHGWSASGNYLVTLWAYQEGLSRATNATLDVQVLKQPVHYVAERNASPVAPYRTWATAATNIQDAVDAASVIGALVLVSNGVYRTGGRVAGGCSNRLAVTTPLAVRSVNGPDKTVIEGRPAPGTTNGDLAVRCVYLGPGSSLTGFTLTNGATRRFNHLGGFIPEQSGGGVWCASSSAMVSDCVLTGNSAYERGGGAAGGTLNNCLFSNNRAWAGGGAANSTLNNCTLSANAADNGGGTSGGVLNNCIVYHNVVHANETNYAGGTINYSCLAPLPADGVGNFSDPPLFVDQAAGDFRLQPSSPCINAGFNGAAPAGSDLDGNPRVVGRTVDVGSYEFQAPQSTISYAWLHQYGLPINASTDGADADSDQFNNWQEWRAGTNPTNALSALRFLPLKPIGPDLVVTWQSVAGHSYFLEGSSNTEPMISFQRLASFSPTSGTTTSFIHTNAARSGALLYRVGVD